MTELRNTFITDYIMAEDILLKDRHLIYNELHQTTKQQIKLKATNQIVLKFRLRLIQVTRDEKMGQKL